MQSKQNRLVKNTLIIAVGKLSTQFLTFLLLPLYTAFLTPEEFGQIDLITIYIGLFATTLTIQMEMAVFRHLIDARGNREGSARAISSSLPVLFVGMAVGLIGILCFGLLTSVSISWLLAGLFASAAVIGYLLQVARGLGRNDLFAVASVITGLTNVALTVVLIIVMKWGIDGVLSAGIAANVIGSIFLVASTKLLSYIKRSAYQKQETRALLAYAWPLVPNNISLWGINGISRTIIVATLGFAAMGIFAAAAKFPLIYMALYGVFAMSWTEAASVNIKSKNDTFFSSVTDSMVRIFGGLALLITAGVSLIFPLFVASDFAEGRQYVPVLIVGAFFASLVTHYGAIYLAVRKTKQVALITLQAVLISSALTLTLTSVVGLYAPAIALVLTYLYLAIMRHRDVQKYVTVGYNKSTYPILLLLSCVVVGLYYVDTVLASILSIAVAVGGFILLNRSSIGMMKNIVLGKLKRRNEV